MNPVRPNDQQLAALAQWRMLALEKMSYLASILLRLDVWNAPGLGTYAVDRNWRLYIDFDHAMTNETVQQGAESLLHECGHILGEHARIADDLGVGPREHRLWNAAADAAWNDDLEAAGCTALHGMWVTPDQFGAPTNQTPQHYYALLLNKTRPPSGSRASERDADQDQNGNAGDPRPGGTSSGAKRNTDPGSGGGYAGCGSGAGAGAAPCEFGDDTTGAPITPIEAKAILIQTAEQIVKSRGTAPASMVEQAEMILKPSVTPWQRLLAAHIRAAHAWVAGQVDQSYTRRSRRRDNTILRPLNPNPAGGRGRKMIKPGWIDPKPTIEVIVDTSGSMSVTDLATCRSEIEGIARRIGVRGEALRVTEVDAAVQSSRRYASARALGGIHGRGGTDMRVGIDNALQRPPRPDILITMTDGATPWPNEPTKVPLIIVLVTNSDKPPPTPTWARTVVIRPAD